MINDDSATLGNNEIVAHFDDEKDDSLKIRLQRIEDVPGCLVLYLTGYIDTYNSNYFQKRVAKAIEAGFIKLIFHIAGTNFVSSTEIGCYTAFLKAIKPRGGDLVLLEMQPKVYEVYQLLGFAQFFHIKEDLDEAVGLFAVGGEDVRSTMFPRIFKCPICSKKLKADKSGRFRCSECKTILAIDNSGQVFIG
jgi:anti-sigma B factor antagonist